MIKKYYELTRWERVRHWDDILTFQKIDGMYAQWRSEDWSTRIGNYDSYELGDDWIFNPILWKTN